MTPRAVSLIWWGVGAVIYALCLGGLLSTSALVSCLAMSGIGLVSGWVTCIIYCVHLGMWRKEPLGVYDAIMFFGFIAMTVSLMMGSGWTFAEIREMVLMAAAFFTAVFAFEWWTTPPEQEVADAAKEPNKGEKHG